MPLRLGVLHSPGGGAVTTRADRVVPGVEPSMAVHGELGPDHVLVDRGGKPVRVGIEGLMYLDIEWEHAFLRLRFGSTTGGGTAVTSCRVPRGRAAERSIRRLLARGAGRPKHMLHQAAVIVGGIYREVTGVHVACPARSVVVPDAGAVGWIERAER